MSALPILYTFRRCPYAMRARMALIVSDMPCELREVDLKAKPAAMLEASPKGTVPVLQFADGTVLDESLDIMLWALTQTGVPGWLDPQDGGLDDMLDLVGRNDGDFKRHLDRYKYPDRYPDESPEPLAQRAAACRYIDELDALLAKSDFLFGPEPSLADLAAFPFVRQFAAVDADWFASLARPRLQAWLNAWQHSELFTTAMRKHSVWLPGDIPVHLLAN